jgi:peptidoglycan/LPS O-acetylase OafA/YrhL
LYWFLNLKPLRWTGKISYGLYLWHWPIILIASAIPYGSEGIKDVAIFVVTYSIAAASFYYLEQPFLRMKHKFGHAKTDAPTHFPSRIEIMENGQMSYQDVK